MTRLTALTGLLVLISWTGIATAQGSVYKWVDPAGVTHYSDQPPADTAAEELAIRVRRTDRAALQTRLRDQAAMNEAVGLRESQEAADAAEAANEREQVRAERRDICRQAQDRVAKYSTARRLYKPGPDGERIYLTDAEIDAERAAALRAVDEWCSD